MSVLRELTVHDPRPPQEIQAAIEREIMTVLAAVPAEPRLTYTAQAQASGVPFRVTLRFEAAHDTTNRYTLRFEALDAALAPAALEAQRRALDGWFALWTRDFTSEPGGTLAPASTERYRSLAEQARQADARLRDVAAVQREILDGMRRGQMFSTAHKEGGTTIRHAGGCFVRADYGESSRVEKFHDDAGFLAFLRRFYEWETSRGAYPGKATELDAWRLILRRLEGERTPAGPAAAVPFVTRFNRLRLLLALGVAAIALVFVLVFGTPWLRVKTTGAPIGPSVQTAEHVATLVLRVEPYLPFGHKRRNDQYRFDVLVHSKTDPASRRVISLARHRPSSAGNARAALLGADGDVVWLQLPEITACNLRTGQVITAADLERANPALGDLVAQGHYEVDGRLRVSSRDQQRWFEFDPATLAAVPVPKPARTGWRDPIPKPEDLLSQGGRLSPTEWIGVHAAPELARDFKPRLSVPREAAFEKARVPRRLHRGQLETTGARTALVEMVPLSADDYVAGTLVRATRDGGLLRLADPDSVLLLHRPGQASGGTLAVTRVDRGGRPAWQAASGLGELDQVLPDAKVLSLIGRRPAVPDKVSEPLLVTIDLAAGRVATRSLWVQD
ncbi:MAG: hypothetical protein JNL92_16830 [Opitutaceae bacterium]|nr:hypothetical protein [Opitutaceae bacterium]